MRKIFILRGLLGLVFSCVSQMDKTDELMQQFACTSDTFSLFCIKQISSLSCLNKAAITYRRSESEYLRTHFFLWPFFSWSHFFSLHADESDVIGDAMKKAQQRGKKRQRCLTSGDIRSYRRQSHPHCVVELHTETHLSSDNCSLAIDLANTRNTK